MSKIQGGLEVFGQKADLIIVNPNGIELNGVKTINSDRFVAAAANVTKQGNQRILSTSENGTVVIGQNGVATNGLSYFDVVAKTIEQKGAASPEKIIKITKLLISPLPRVAWIMI
ncbi:protein PfhB2 [Actinobacillus equuli]|nr:protein PfhB2 [Actinobacillus equuli]